jgi:O-antigen/teichoic acid export membrane protein
LLFTPFLIRKLGQSEYGLFSIAFSAIGILSILDMGLGNANIRYTAKYQASGNKEDENSLHGMFLLLYIVLGILALSVGLVISQNTYGIFGNKINVTDLPKLKTMLTLVVISLSLSFPLSVFGFIIQGYERFVYAKLMQLLRIVLIPLLSVVVLLSGYRSVGAIAVIALTNVSLIVVDMIYCFKVLRIKLSFRFIDFALFKEILTYSFFVFLGVLALQLNNNSNQFILGAVYGPVQVALYALGFNLVINFSSLANAISGVFLPVLTKIPQDGYQIREYNNYFIAIGRLQFYVIALFYLGFIIFGRSFIILWAGPDFEASYYVCLIPLTTYSIYLIQNVGISILQAQNKHRFSSILFAVMSVINIVISVILSARFGAIGGAVAIAFTWLIGHGFIMNTFYAYKIKLNIRGFWMQIIKIFPSLILPVAFGLLFSYFFIINSWLSLSVGAILFAAIYCSSVILISFNKFEKDTILQPVLHRLRFLVTKA